MCYIQINHLKIQKVKGKPEGDIGITFSLALISPDRLTSMPQTSYWRCLPALGLEVRATTSGAFKSGF